MATKKDEQSKRDSLVGRFDQSMYGDLLANFGPPPSNNDIDDDAKLTDSSQKDVRAAHHDARNDSGVRDPKPNSND